MIRMYDHVHVILQDACSSILHLSYGLQENYTLQEEATSTSIQTPRAELNQSFAVSHNNSSDQIQLEFNNAFHSSLAFVKVFNINGQCIQVEQFSINAGENQLSTQPFVMAKGIYMVSLFLDNNVVTKKIAIN